MEKEPRNSLALIGIGIGIGAATILILLWVGARITGLNIGVVEVEFPTQAVSIQQNSTQSPAQLVATVTSQPFPTSTQARVAVPPTTSSIGGIAPCRAEELGPWTPIAGKGRDITIDTGESFVHADLWRPGGPQIKAGYDDVSVILPPGVKVTIPNVAGQAWKYIPGCAREYVESQVERYNQEKRQGGWTIITITFDELCQLAGCR